MSKATLYKTDGTQEPCPPKGDAFTLAELQAAVGGYIAKVQVGGKEAYCDEDGDMKRLPANPFIQGLVGNVVVIDDPALNLR